MSKLPVPPVRKRGRETMPVCKDCVVGLFHACHNEEYCRQEKNALIEQAQEAAENEGHSLAKFTKRRKVAYGALSASAAGRR
jgi:hypothetical protein